MRDRAEAKLKITGLRGMLWLVLADLEGLDDRVARPERPSDGAQHFIATCRHKQFWSRRWVGSRPARRVGQRVGVWHQVEAVVAVEVADNDRVDLGVVDPLAQLAENAAAAIDEELRTGRFDEVAAAGSTSVWPRRRLAKNCDLHSAVRPFRPLLGFYLGGDF